MPRRIVVVGAHAAGVEAASAARRADRTAEITLITDERHAGYSRCGIPFVLAGHIPSFRGLVVYPLAYFKMMKLNLRTETVVTAIDPSAKVVEVRDKEGIEEKIPYDSLILATGAFPFVPPIRGREKEGVYVVRTIEDGERIDRALKEAKSAVVVGAGLIGLEVASSFVERGAKTTVVELLPRVLPLMLDDDMARVVHEELEKAGMRIIVSRGVDEILGAEKVTGVSVAGEEIKADLVVVATGVRANVELAKRAGIAIGETRAIKVDARMETSVKDVYAAGDCVECISLITKRPILSQLGTTAVRQARVAGVNAAGGQAFFGEVLGASVTKLLGLEVGATGLTEEAAKRAGLDVISGTLSSKTRSEYYPGALPIKVKIVAERDTLRIVGAQIVGGEEVTQRINALSFAMQKGMTLKELAAAETCYAPPVSETWEPMVLVAQKMLR